MHKREHELPYWLAANQLHGVGASRLMHWLDHFEDIETFFKAPADQLASVGVSETVIQALQQPDWRQVELAITWGQQTNQHIIVLDDARYPSMLKEISSPPIALFIRGDLTVMSTQQLAIVGSRHATPAGIRDASEFARIMAQAGFTITSGLALGIDGAAHRGALSVNGKTIAVMGTGLHTIYPGAHRQLADDIASQGGAVISEFPLEVKPLAENFPRRNRVISGLSMGVLIIEAALKSGSLITARYALEQGREVFAIPGSIHNPLSRGCHHLIRQGATLVESADDILQELGGFMQNKAEVVQNKDLANQHRLLLDQIDYAMTPMDMIILRSGLTTSEVSSILLSLELKGYIESVSGGYMRIT